MDFPQFDLPQLLTALNNRLGWAQRDLARAAGMDAAHVSRIMNGQKPQRGTLEKIAAAYHAAGLDVNADWLQEATEPTDQDAQPMIPDHWLRLVLGVLAQDVRLQDYLYRRWSDELRQVAELVYKSGNFPD